jgi:hypothetical protein
MWMKVSNLVLLFFFLATMPLTINTIKASQSSVFQIEKPDSINANSDFTVSLYVNSTEEYNSFTATIDLIGLKLVGYSANSSDWLFLSDPSLTGGKISLSGTVLASYYTGSKKLITLVLKTAGSNISYALKANGSIFSFYNPGVPINLNESVTMFNIQVAKKLGDVNNDQKVDLTDLSIIALNWDKETSEGDLNNDNKVNLADLSILAEHWLK